MQLDVSLDLIFHFMLTQTTAANSSLKKYVVVLSFPHSPPQKCKRILQLWSLAW